MSRWNELTAEIRLKSGHSPSSKRQENLSRVPTKTQQNKKKNRDNTKSKTLK